MDIAGKLSPIKMVLRLQNSRLLGQNTLKTLSVPTKQILLSHPDIEEDFRNINYFIFWYILEVP